MPLNQDCHSNPRAWSHFEPFSWTLCSPCSLQNQLMSDDEPRFFLSPSSESTSTSGVSSPNPLSKHCPTLVTALVVAAVMANLCWGCSLWNQLEAKPGAWRGCWLYSHTRSTLTSTPSSTASKTRVVCLSVYSAPTFSTAACKVKSQNWLQQAPSTHVRPRN